MELPGYRIIRKIAQGGMSTVYLAIQLSVGREVALKVMSPALNADPVFSERFQREANIVGQLSHPNIVAIYDIGRHQDYNYIAMDYLPGGSINDKLKAGISVQEALRITREVAKALDHAHEKGYIHRDIKPENILFREDQSAVLTDFGVAKTVASASRMTNAGTVVGTPHYMSPEQVRGRPVDGRADIYSLGVVFFEMLTGSVPFDADESVAIAVKHLTAPIPRLPAQYLAYQKIVDSALAKEPDQRYQRGADLKAAIDALEGSAGLDKRVYAATDSTHVQIISLLRALLSTSCQAVRELLARLGNFVGSLRWTLRRGFYQHPRVRVIDIQQGGGENQTGADRSNNRITLVSTRLQQAVHYRPLFGKRGWLSRIVTLAVFCALIWGAFSFALHRFNLPGETLLPEGVQRSAVNTATWLGADDPTPETPVSNTQQPAQPRRTSELLEADEFVQSVNLDLDFLTQESEPEPEAQTTDSPTQSLRVEPDPENARVRILNIPERYYPGIELLPGRYHIEVTHPGFDMQTEWVEIADQPLTVSMSLKKSLVPGATFRNDLALGGTGPDMVIVPAGTFTMGSKLDTNTTPEREITIPQPFAISKFEITFAEYDRFAQATGRSLPSDNGWGRDSRPVINVSWYDAQAYVEWLSEQTGANYRLATEAESAYVARAGTSTVFWWGDDPDLAGGMANCRRGCDSDYAGIFISRTAPVGSYPANAFGLHDTAGNVSEWVQDCYRNHLLEVPDNGDAFTPADCALRTLRGGSMNSRVGRIASHVRESAPPRTRENYLGFRVVVELVN